MLKRLELVLWVAAFVYLFALAVGCGGSAGAPTSTGGAPGTGGQLATGGQAGSTSTGGSTGGGLGGVNGGAAGMNAGGAGVNGGQSGMNGQAGAAGGAAAGSGGGAGVGGGASGHGQAGAGGAAGSAAGGAGGAGSGPSCGAAPAPSTTCNSLTIAGPCVLPTFVVGSWPAGVFSSGTTPKSGTYQLTSVTYYGSADDAGAGFDCEGSAPLRETIAISGFAPTFNLQVAQAGAGIALAVQNGSFAPMSSSYSGPPSLPTSYTYMPSCASGPTGTNTEAGGWGATSTTVTLSGFTRVGCMHGGKLRTGTEVATFTLVQ